MNLTHATTLMVAALSLHAGAAVELFAPSTNPPGTPLVPDEPGWTQSEPNPAPDAPLAFVSTHMGGTGYGIGAWYDVPSASVFSASHPGTGLVLPGCSLTVPFGITAATDQWPGQETFSFTVSDDSSGPVFSVLFLPTSDPEQWNVAWSSGGVVSAPFAGVLAGGHYDLVIAFSESSSPQSVAVAVDGPLNSMSTVAGVADLSGASCDTVSISMASDGEWGDDTFVIGAATAEHAPEAEIPLILGVFLVLGLTLRARRTA